jgi:hypothetical protein
VQQHSLALGEAPPTRPRTSRASAAGTRSVARTPRSSPQGARYSAAHQLAHDSHPQEVQAVETPFTRTQPDATAVASPSHQDNTPGRRPHPKRGTRATRYRSGHADARPVTESSTSTGEPPGRDRPEGSTTGNAVYTRRPGPDTVTISGTTHEPRTANSDSTPGKVLEPSRHGSAVPHLTPVTEFGTSAPNPSTGSPARVPGGDDWKRRLHPSVWSLGAYVRSGRAASGGLHCFRA